MPKIVIVEDDDNIRELVGYALNSAGFAVEGFEDGQQLGAAIEAGVDLILLDIMLPGEDGISILNKLRANKQTQSVPVIMLTAKTGEFDRVKGLDLGADDYITKPFSVMELVSRVKAVLRRSQGSEVQIIRLGDLEIDPGRRIVTAGGEGVSLTYKEFELLLYLATNAGMVLSRDKITATVWGYDFEGESRTVDMHVKTLRQKLGACAELIKTVRNVGYKCEV